MLLTEAGGSGVCAGAKDSDQSRRSDLPGGGKAKATQVSQSGENGRIRSRERKDQAAAKTDRRAEGQADERRGVGQRHR